MRANHRRLTRIWIAAGCLALVAGAAAPARLAAQPAQLAHNCKQLWDEATTQTAAEAQPAAHAAAGAAPSAAATAWANAWRQFWLSSWTTHGAMLMPIEDIFSVSGRGPVVTGRVAAGRDCCDSKWFEHAAQAGKGAWARAWQAPSTLAGADKAWADKYAAAYADAWARAWFLHFPVVCARARANAAAKAFADADTWTATSAWAWADASASATALAQARASTWTTVWAEAGAATWARAGAEAMAAAAASARSSAMAAASGNCAMARSSACAEAAAAAYAAAWAEAGATAFADAFAAAWAEASARAFARAVARAYAAAEARAFALAIADAWARASARAFAVAWREKLANEGQLPQIVNWWKTPGAPMPAIATIQKVLAMAYKTAFKSAFDNALSVSFRRSRDWDPAYRRAEREAERDMVSWSYSWVHAWTESWATAWTYTWARVYAVMCSRAAAAVCAECPCPTPGTTTTGRPGTTTTDRPRTIAQPRGFNYTLVGLGVTAGSIFEIVVRNTSGEPIVVEVPGGTVFRPDNPDYQRMITADDRNVPVEPNQTARAPLEGYCLDYGKQPPPATRAALEVEPVLVASLDPGTIVLPSTLSGEAQAAAVSYQLDENPAAYAPFLRIIQAGSRAAAEGKFHKDLPPDKYKTSVIQRALWTYATRGTPAPHTRETLLADIRRQVKDSGGTQTEEQVQELVNHLMEDVAAVLRAAGLN